MISVTCKVQKSKKKATPIQVHSADLFFFLVCEVSSLGCHNLPAMGVDSIYKLSAIRVNFWMSLAPNLHFVRQLLISDNEKAIGPIGM